MSKNRPAGQEVARQISKFFHLTGKITSQVAEVHADVALAMEAIGNNTTLLQRLAYHAAAGESVEADSDAAAAAACAAAFNEQSV